MNYAAFALVALLPAAGIAQTLNFSSLDQLASKAKEKAEINLDEAGLRLAAGALPQAQAALASKLGGVKAFTLRHYEFDPGSYSEADLEPLRKQIAADTSWMRIITIKETKESVDILMRQGADGKPSGFLLIVAEPKELTVIHASGSIDLAGLREIVSSKVAFAGVAPKAE